MIGTIYRIIHIESDIQYIGSTFDEPRKRWQKHKYDFLKWMSDESRKSCSIVPFFKKYGIDKFRLIKIKEYDVIDRKHLEAYEQLWISKIKCVNKKESFRIGWLYYQANRDYFNAKKKEYREANKHEINAKKKEVITCECGSTYTRSHRARHVKTKRHIDAMVS